ncbi:uncharacterized protein LOC143476597 isoform X1 [Brachyhypopomus gauderio]|uniref:uncharacterized protein LOC143476597 isoform X1 n=1 Tax=Brachyhypopomus gauderio TaxID=698409 RepID=UPI0040438FC5
MSFNVFTVLALIATVTATVAAINTTDDPSSMVNMDFNNSRNSTMPTVTESSLGANISSSVGLQPSLTTISTKAVVQNANISSSVGLQPSLTTISTKAVVQNANISSSVGLQPSLTTISTKAVVQNGEKQRSDKTAFITIFILVVMCLAAAITCYIVQRKQRRFSVDLHVKNEDAQIPLSDVEPEVFESHNANDMQTFTTVEASSTLGGLDTADGVKGPSEAEVKPAGAPDTGEGELTILDLNEEPTISTKTSMESLDEPLNDNKSNNNRD